MAKRNPTLVDETPITLHDCQMNVFDSKARFRILVAGRRFGKTFLALTEMLHAAQKPGAVVWYVGPNDHQSKRVAWERIKRLTKKFQVRKPSETELRIDLIWDSTIRIAGAYHPDSLRGDGIDFIVLDEYASVRPEAWNEVFRPALADRKGRALFIGTPKGRNHFHELYEYAKTDPEWEGFQYTTAQGGIVDAMELSSAARQLDPDSYRQEFEAQFTKGGEQRAYYAFDKEVNVAPVHFLSAQPLIWTLDFNVNPMCMLLIQRDGENVYVLDEIVVRPDANTEKACRAFEQKAAALYAQTPGFARPLKVEIYGDASGAQRRTAAVSTDWQIVKDFFKLWVGTYLPSFKINKSNPLVRDRVNCVNARLKNYLDEVRLYIHPNCRELIKDLERVLWAVDAKGTTTSDLDKSDPARTHASDALGYYIAQAFPMRGMVGERGERLILG